MKNRGLLLLIFTFLFSEVVSAQNLLYLSGSGAQDNLTIQSGSKLYVQGGLVANAGAQGLTLNGELHLTDGTISNSSDWSDNTVGGCLSGTGIVYLESGFLQNMSGTSTTFYNLQFNNTSVNTNGIRLLSNIKVANQIVFQDGLAYANANTLLITSNSASSVSFMAPNTANYSQSWIAAIYPGGKLDREMINNTASYAFPVGNTTQPQLLEVVPTNITGISRLSASWENSVTGAAPISITECGTSYMMLSNGGEWHLRPANGGTYGSGIFAAGQMTVSAHNLSAFPALTDNQFAILNRPEGSMVASTWFVPIPNCTSLAGFNMPGRTLASDYATRINLTSWSDNNSQIGIGTTFFPLPIELLSLNAWDAGEVNKLNWTTASEINSDHFEVERSGDGYDYKFIGALNAGGNSTHSIQYNFTDNDPLPGLGYYRLKMVDGDLSFRYSNTVVVERPQSAMENFLIYPNPGSGDIFLQVQSSGNKEAVLQLTDALGRILSIHQVTIQEGNNLFTIPMNGLEAALYFVNISDKKSNNSCVLKYLKYH